MIYALKIPQLNPQMTRVRLETLHAAEGQGLKIGDKLLDLSVDLSSAFSQDCPPISYYRLIARERLVFRKWMFAAGDVVECETAIALLANEAEEPLTEPGEQAVRIMSAGIMFHPDMWSASNA